MLAFECRGEDLVVGVLHPKQFELAHQIQDFGSFHDHVLLSWSYRAQSAAGTCRSLSASGVRMLAAGPGSRWRARMLMITSDERTPSDIAWAQAASTANPAGSSQSLNGAPLRRAPGGRSPRFRRAKHDGMATGALRARTAT